MRKAVRGSGAGPKYGVSCGAECAAALARAALVLSLLALGTVASLPRAAAAQESLGSGTLLVAGTTLAVAPESQTVPFDTPTIVHTTLLGYDTAQGTLPADLRVVGDFSGPEIDGSLELVTVPNEPFRIPRLSLKGQYRLDNIRLVQAGELLAYAEPRSAGVLVTQILITQVTSRPLTLEEIRSYGITTRLAVEGGGPVFAVFAAALPPCRARSRSVLPFLASEVVKGRSRLEGKSFE